MLPLMDVQLARGTAWRACTTANQRSWYGGQQILALAPCDYERDNEKWSIPGRHGYRLIFATWEKVSERPNELVAELLAALSATQSRGSAAACPA
jgi:hypothetical protein